MGRKARLRRQKDETKEAQSQDLALQRKRQGTRKLLLVAIPVVVLALSLLFWFVVKSSFATGLTALAGIAIWIGLFASSLSQDIPPADRSSSANIDFGTRKR